MKGVISCWEISFKTKSSSNPENLSTEIRKKEKNFFNYQITSKQEYNTHHSTFVLEVTKTEENLTFLFT